MNRVSSYFLILIGAPLGYIASYFFQPVVIRRLVSLAEYISHASRVLQPNSEVFTASISQTAWIGIFLGVVLMGILIFIIRIGREVH